MEIRVKKEGIFPVKVIYADNAENIENLLKWDVVRMEEEKIYLNERVWGKIQQLMSKGKVDAG